jgi:hypothetical protein
MSTVKFLLITLLAVGSATISCSETSANVQVPPPQGQGRAQLLAAVQHGPERVPWHSLFTDEQPVEQVAAPASSHQWLVALLFAALAAYQLRRNQRALSHRLSSY